MSQNLRWESKKITNNNHWNYSFSLWFLFFHWFWLFAILLFFLWLLDHNLMTTIKMIIWLYMIPTLRNWCLFPPLSLSLSLGDVAFTIFWSLYIFLSHCNGQAYHRFFYLPCVRFVQLILLKITLIITISGTLTIRDNLYNCTNRETKISNKVIVNLYWSWSLKVYRYFCPPCFFLFLSLQH